MNTVDKNLDKVPLRETPPRSLKTILKVFVLLLVIGTAAYFYWINTPTFALIELERSLQERDLATFYSRLDLDRIYDSSIDALTAQRLASTDSTWDTIQANLGGGVTKVLKSQVMNQLKHDIELRFRSDAPTGLGKTKAAVPLKEFFEDVQSIVFAKPVRTDAGALVNVQLTLGKMQKIYPLTLKMEKVGLWKITGFEALSSTLARYESDRIRKVDEHNLKVKDDMKSRLPFFGQIRQEDDWTGLQKKVHFEFLIQNKGTSRLNSLKGQLTVKDAEGKVKLVDPFEPANLNLAVGEKKVFLLNKDLGLFSGTPANLDGLNLTLNVDEAIFEDGSNLRTVKLYEEL